MARNKSKIEFEGFEEVLAKLKKLDGDIRGTTDKALIETNKFITKQAMKAIEPHSVNYSGDTKKSLKEYYDTKWEGNIASIDTGFDIAKGGLPSIFLMYGTPRMDKDQKLYNAFFGTKTKREVMKIQEEIFYDELRRVDR